jgi:oligoendopeptidase F
MIDALPENPLEFMDWPWSKIEPIFQGINRVSLSAASLEGWLEAWSRLDKYLDEAYQRLWVATTLDTVDQAAQRRYEAFLDEIYPHAQAADQVLKQKLLDSGLQPPGYTIPMRNMWAEVEIFREENLSLLSEDLKLGNEYDRIIGAQTIFWDGQELTVAQLKPVLLVQDRQERERAWRLAAQRQLDDRQAINELWGKMVHLRCQIAANAGLGNYRDYRWKQLLRHDYSPQDCVSFQRAIEQVVVPAASQHYEKRRKQLGVESLRPWDLFVDPLVRQPLKPYTQVEELANKTGAIFQRVDPGLGAYFTIMQREKLLDLENRKGKAPGGYCTSFWATRRPFIFTNAVGLHEDVLTMLHEGGHAFHVFESAHLKHHQVQVGIEFAEVASMAMELLASPYLTIDHGGFYTPADAARARLEHLEEALLFWPYMAVVDAFQHWVYQYPEAAQVAENCDAHWSELWDRFMPGVDWSGLEAEKVTGWQRKPHIHSSPFYYVEYGLAQLGAFQVWGEAQKDQAGTVASYRHALSLGGTASLPSLFQSARARFAFDVEALEQAVGLIERTIEQLESGKL